MNISMVFFYNACGKLKLAESKIMLSFQSINTLMFRIFYLCFFFFSSAREFRARNNSMEPRDPKKQPNCNSGAQVISKCS